MKLSSSQLMNHLAKNLAPVYLITGDEILLVQEAVDVIRDIAHHNSWNERVSITPDSGTDLGKLLYPHTHSLSLFANKKIIELNLTHIKLNTTNGKILEEYANPPLKDILLIIYSTKLDAKVEKSSWYQSIDKAGVILPIWPITAEQLPQWLIQRARKFNLNITRELAEHFAERVEGNLFAAAQEIEKLCLLYPS